MSVGTISGIGNGLCMPLMTIVLGDVINSFGETRNNKEVADAVSKVIKSSVTKTRSLVISVNATSIEYSHFSGFTRICVNWQVNFQLFGKQKKMKKTIIRFSGSPK